MSIGPDVRPHPEIVFLPFRICFVSGSRICVAFLVELGVGSLNSGTDFL
jgi:hypothetical protein